MSAILLTITAGDATAQVSDQVRSAPPIVLLAVIVVLCLRFGRA